jgi:3-deoxy-D-manno-octulosonic acid hydroxylase-like protein
MACLKVDDYSATGWAKTTDASAKARHYCSELERGAIVFFSQPPFDLSAEDINFLVSLTPTDSRLHKNISYRPEQDLLRGFDDRANEARVHHVIRHYALQVQGFVSRFLAPYDGKFQMDYTSFRPLEEEGRNLPLHKRNDLLHVDAFPSRPTRGGRILRVFTNVNPDKDRAWKIGERFPELAGKFADSAGLKNFATGSAVRGLKSGLSRIGLPIPDRAPYDEFMLHFHDWLKENGDFQAAKEGKEEVHFPPMSTWLVFTDGVPHAALSGQFAMEQTFIIPVEALVTPEVSPVRVLERLAGKSMM